MEASDAKDMIVFFLEQIHKEINLIKPPEINDQSQNPDQYNRDVMLNHFINEFTKSSKSIVSDLFFTIAEMGAVAKGFDRFVGHAIGDENKVFHSICASFRKKIRLFHEK